MDAEGFCPAVGLLLVVLWLGSVVAGDGIHRVWAARLGSLAFVGHAIFLGTGASSGGSGDWLTLIIASSLVGGFVYGGSLLALPILLAAHHHTLGGMGRSLRSWGSSRREAADERRRRREQQEYGRRAREEYERAAPERERQRQENERRRAAAAQDARRRRDARAACELAYSRCAVEIGERFSRQELERFMGTYMGEEHAADDVERRGEELRRVMEDYRQPAKPEKKRTMQDLAEWYLREKQAIESLPLDEFVRLEYVAALDMRYAELTQELLQRIEP